MPFDRERSVIEWCVVMGILLQNEFQQVAKPYSGVQI